MPVSFQLQLETEFDRCYVSAMERTLEEKLREDVRGCSLPAALAAMGERWAFLIVRGAFNGLRHFEQFQAELGIARNILSDRLGRLVDHDILARAPLVEDRRKVEYLLTEKGEALLPTLLALRQWGERWASCGPASPVLVDARDHRPIGEIGVFSHDGRRLGRRDLLWALPEDVVRD